MDKEINPIVAGIIIFVALALISLYIWADGKETDVGGPDQMQVDAMGNVYIRVADTLYKFTDSFTFLQAYDLPEYGVQTLVGDFAFFANGDVLLRKGEYDPGLLEAIWRFLRFPDLNEPVTQTPGQGLYRCNLDTRDCTPFGEKHLDFDVAFHLSIDTATDTVYLSDTSRHTLRKYDSEGKELAGRRKGFFFPNQIMLFNHKLLVANTNHHAVEEVDSSNERFGEIISTHVLKDRAIGRKNWTFSFARVGEGWWVNNMDNNMSYGIVAVYDKRWQFENKISLPDDADPIDIVVLKDRVLITDLANLRIYQLDFSGNPMHKRLAKPLEDKLTILRSEKQYYRLIALAAIVSFSLLLILGFGLALLIGLKEPEPELSWSVEEKQFSSDNPQISWITKDKRKLRGLKLSLYLLALLPLIAIVALLMPGETFLPIPLFSVLIMCVFFAIVLFAIKAHISTEIGVLDDFLVIKNAKFHAAGKGKNILYSNSFVLVDNMWISLNRQNTLFDMEEIVQQVMPRLKNATYVKPGQMALMQLRRRKSIAAFLAVMVLGFVFILLYQSLNHL